MDKEALVTDAPHDKRMPLGDHLDELRLRLIRSLIGVGVAAILCIFVSSTLLNIAARPVQKVFRELNLPPEVAYLQEVTPGEGMLVQLKLALYAGFLLASPYVFWEIWRFISVGLHAHEKRFVYYFGPLIVGSFVAGTLFTYFMVLPYGLYFLLEFNPVWLRSQFSVNAYLGTLTGLAMAFGLVFELPLIMMFVTRLGFVDWRWFARHRRAAYFLSVVLGAFLTPPDVFTQLMLAFPMMGLYEMGIQLSKLNIRKLIGAPGTDAGGGADGGEA